MSEEAEFSKEAEFQKLRENLSFTEKIDSKDHPRYVNFSEARGTYLRNLLADLGLKLTDETIVPMVAMPDEVHLLFCGHRGCGKSTELRILGKRIQENSETILVHVNAEADLFIEDIAFIDVFILILEKLLEKAERENIQVDQLFTDPIYKLLAERIQTEEITEDYGFGVGVDLKFIAKLRASFKNNAKHTDTIRTRITTRYSELAEHFNRLVSFIEEAKQAKLFFVVDGTDKLLDIKKAEQVFIHSANLITQLSSRFIYAAPISLPLQNATALNYYRIHNLPMVKLFKGREEARQEKPIESHYELFQEFVTKRVPEDWFENPKEIDSLIRDSGGNPRHLIELLANAWTDALPQLKINRETTEQAGKKFFNDHFRFLEKKDLEALRDEYQNPNPLLDDTKRNLLFQLTLLEYNGNEFWRFPHPALKYSPHFPYISSSE